MRLEEFHEPTQEQIDLKDEKAKKLSKENFLTIAGSLGIKLETVPKPKIILDLPQRVLNVMESTWFTDQVEYMCLLYAFDGYRSPHSANNYNPWINVVPALMSVCYYLACNNIKVTQFPNMEEMDLFNISNIFWDGKIAIYKATLIEKSAIMQAELVRCEDAEYTYSEHEIPNSLIHHLQNFYDVKNMLLEVCRIQMLGPKYKRADDALGALVSAWNIVNKEA